MKRFYQESMTESNFHPCQQKGAISILKTNPVDAWWSNNVLNPSLKTDAMQVLVGFPTPWCSVPWLWFTGRTRDGSASVLFFLKWIGALAY